MAQVTQPGIWYPEGYPGSAFDLAEVLHGVYPDDVTKAEVRFRSSQIRPVIFDRADFDTAYSAYLGSVDVDASPHVWFPSGIPGPFYNLREVVAWGVTTNDPSSVSVHFTGGIPLTTFNAAAFEAAKQASIDAE